MIAASVVEASAALGAASELVVLVFEQDVERGERSVTERDTKIADCCLLSWISAESPRWRGRHCQHVCLTTASPFNGGHGEQDG